MNDKERTDQAHDDELSIGESGKAENEWTDFGYGFATAFSAGLLFFAPWYFFDSPFPGGVALAFSIILYLAGLVLLLFGMGFFSTGLQKTPELRQLFPSLSKGEDAWEGAYGTMLFLVIVLVIQGVMRGFELTGIAAVVAKVLTYVFAVGGITQVAQAIDGFVIRPLIATAAKGPKEFEPLIKRIRQIAVLVGFIVALIAGIAQIIDVF